MYIFIFQAKIFSLMLNSLLNNIIYKIFIFNIKNKGEINAKIILIITKIF